MFSRGVFVRCFYNSSIVLSEVKEYNNPERNVVSESGGPAVFWPGPSDVRGRKELL